MSNPTTTSIPFIGSDHPMQAGILAWQAVDNTVVLANADYLDTNITGRFIVGAKVTNNGNGTWTYEYAVYNHNADRAGGSFTVPLPPSAIVTNVGFHGVFCHSGEPYENTATSPADWTSTVALSNVGSRGRPEGTPTLRTSTPMPCVKGHALQLPLHGQRGPDQQRRRDHRSLQTRDRRQPRPFDLRDRAGPDRGSLRIGRLQLRWRCGNGR